MAFKAKRCSHPGCTNNAVTGGICRRHGSKAKECSHPACTNNVVKAGVCRRHGAKAKGCSHQDCTNNTQKGGVCCKHGAKKKRCRYPQCPSVAVKNGVCHRHGAQRKRCSRPECNNVAVKSGVCQKHGANRGKRCRYLRCAKMATDSGFCRAHDDSCANNRSQLETAEHSSERLAVCHSLLSLVGTNDFERNIAGVTPQPQNQRSTRENDEIDVDTILQIPHYVSDKFRKVGFARCRNGELLPVLFLGPNDAPSSMRREWITRLNRHLRQGARMAHLVAYYGQESEIGKFGLVDDVYLYDKALEEEFRGNPEREIHRKITQGDALNERDQRFNLALLQFSMARSLPEEYRWAWKSSPFF